MKPRLILTLLCAALLVGLTACSDKKYIISYEVQAKDGGVIRGTTVQALPALTQYQVEKALAPVFQNPRVATNGLVILAIVPLDSEGYGK